MFCPSSFCILTELYTNRLQKWKASGFKRENKLKIMSLTEQRLFIMSSEPTLNHSHFHNRLQSKSISRGRATLAKAASSDNFVICVGKNIRKTKKKPFLQCKSSSHGQALKMFENIMGSILSSYMCMCVSLQKVPSVTRLRASVVALIVLCLTYYKKARRQSGLTC